MYYSDVEIANCVSVGKDILFCCDRSERTVEQPRYLNTLVPCYHPTIGEHGHILAIACSDNLFIYLTNKL